MKVYFNLKYLQKNNKIIIQHVVLLFLKINQNKKYKNLNWRNRINNLNKLM
jgi:hypothetical protein